MKILLVLDNLSSSCGANVGIVYELTKTWMERGCEVYCLAREDKYHDLDAVKASNLTKVWTFPVKEDDVLNDVTKNEKWIKSSSIQKAMYMLTHPMFAQKMIDKKHFESKEIRDEYKRQIEKICAQHSFDAVIAVTEPFYIADALANAKIQANKYTIMMDPYTNNPSTTERTRPRHLAKELLVFETSRKIFALDFVGDDMDYLPENLAGKRVNFCVPKVERRNGAIESCAGDAVSGEGKGADSETTEREITFVYVGQLYDDIRNPKLMLELFTKLPENYILHLYGGGSEKTVTEYQNILESRLITHGWVSSAESAKAQREADILINLNNSIRNMLPSKLVEYINTGKPILNICQIAKCPSLPYMDKYPMALSITPDQNIDDMAEKLISFAEDNSGKVLSHDKVESLFENCISDYVADIMLREMY